MLLLHTLLLSATQLALAQGGCTVTSHSELRPALGSCTKITIKDMQVPVNQALDLDLRAGTTIEFVGTTSFAPTPRPGRSAPLVTISGSNVRIVGRPGSVINGNGQAYWDGVGGNAGSTIDKPKFFRLRLSNSHISGLAIVNAPVHVFSIGNCHGLVLDRITIDNSRGDARGAGGRSLGHNTDAFDVGDSSNVTISNAWVHNQDDCLAVNSGRGITFSNGTCIGGHGLSIGSVGGRSNNTVSDVRILNSVIRDSENGVRIKTGAGQGRGAVTGVTYQDIRLEGITKRGIVVQQDYENGGPTGNPGPDVHIGELTLSGITGHVAGGAKKVYVLCAWGGCSDWRWSGISLSGGSGSSCSGEPVGASQFCH